MKVRLKMDNIQQNVDDAYKREFKKYQQLARLNVKTEEIKEKAQVNVDTSKNIEVASKNYAR